MLQKPISFYRIKVITIIIMITVIIVIIMMMMMMMMIIIIIFPTPGNTGLMFSGGEGSSSSF